MSDVIIPKIVGNIIFLNFVLILTLVTYTNHLLLYCFPIQRGFCELDQLQLHFTASISPFPNAVLAKQSGNT